METVIKNFSKDKSNSDYDICIVIIMSHGSEKENDTIIYGIDENYIFSASVINEFTNEFCKSWIEKPKAILFQVCRYILNYFFMETS